MQVFDTKEEFENYVGWTLAQIWEGFEKGRNLALEFDAVLAWALTSHVFNSDYPNCSANRLKRAAAVATSVGRNYMESHGAHLGVDDWRNPYHWIQ